MVDRVQATINISAYRQLQSEIKNLMYKLNEQTLIDPVIYCCDGPDEAWSHLAEADTILERTIESLAHVEEEDDDE